MTVEKGIRILAGCFILVSLALGLWMHGGWLFLAAFVAVNLIRSAFTGFCPAETVLKKCGLKSREEAI